MSGTLPVVPVRPCFRWLWLFTLPYSLRKHLLEIPCRLAQRLGLAPVWAVAGAILGALPVGVDFLLGRYCNWLVTPILVFPLLLAAAARDSTMRGVVLLGSLMAAHSLTTIALATLFPEYWAELFPPGAAYWDKTRHWIATGESEEYQLSWWVPGHLQLIVAVIFFAYVSLGLTPLWQGFYEVDLMNSYVSQLLVHSDDTLSALMVGWHPWSICRGVGFLFVTFEMTSFSLERMTGTPLSARRTRLTRWLTGLTLLAADMVIKYFALEPVRQILAHGLTG